MRCSISKERRTFRGDDQARLAAWPAPAPPWARRSGHQSLKPGGWPPVPMLPMAVIAATATSEAIGLPPARQLMRGRNYSLPRCVAALSITAMLRNIMSLFSFWNVARSFGSAVCATSLLVAPAAGAETLTMCGQTVPYTVVPPAADVPANMRAFSGPWIGTWATGICNAVIIESIQPDGTVSILDVFGPDSGKPAGSLRYAGKIVGNTLSSAGRTNSIEFTQTSATQMSATYLTSNVQARGTFSRP